jgi:hypothetical protein
MFLGLGPREWAILLIVLAGLTLQGFIIVYFRSKRGWPDVKKLWWLFVVIWVVTVVALYFPLRDISTLLSRSH